MAVDDQSGRGSRLAGANPADTVDGGNAVTAVTGEAQGAPSGRVLVVAQCSDGHRVAISVLHRLAVVDDAHTRCTVHQRPIPSTLVPGIKSAVVDENQSSSVPHIKIRRNGKKKGS